MPPSAEDRAKFQLASDQSLLIYFATQITLEAHALVATFLRSLKRNPIPGVLNVTPAYCSVLVKFDALRWTPQGIEEILRKYLDRVGDEDVVEHPLVEIPVCYGDEFGPDLNDVAAMHELTVAQAIELHASVEYLVYFLGFVPGFAYLGSLPEMLWTPRMPTPRVRVPSGSVGIADRQTGVYPFSTPGGWRLLGRTPLSMFLPDRPVMSLLSLGDKVRFVPISRQRFAALESA